MTRRARVDGDRVSSECPSCGAEVVAMIDPDLGRRGTPVRVRVRCRCGRGHDVLVERRAAARKAVWIPGCWRSLSGTDELPMTVRNLSRTGVLFDLVNGGAPPADGERVVVRFVIDGVQRHEVVKEAVVRRQEEREVGAEFTGAYDRHYDMALALYGSGSPDLSPVAD